MNSFAWALDKLREGKAVRRSGRQAYLHFNRTPEGGLITPLHLFRTIDQSNNEIRGFDLDDILAKDWEALADLPKPVEIRRSVPRHASDDLAKAAVEEEDATRHRQAEGARHNDEVRRQQKETREKFDSEIAEANKPTQGQRGVGSGHDHNVAVKREESPPNPAPKTGVPIGDSKK